MIGGWINGAKVEKDLGTVPPMPARCPFTFSSRETLPGMGGPSCSSLRTLPPQGNLSSRRGWSEAASPPCLLLLKLVLPYIYIHIYPSMNWVRLGPGLLMPENNREASSAEKTDHKNIDLKTWACRALGVPGLVCASRLIYPQLCSRCQ